MFLAGLGEPTFPAHQDICRADRVDETAQCQELRRRRSKAASMGTVPTFTILAPLLWGRESKEAPIPLKRLEAGFAPLKFLL